MSVDDLRSWIVRSAEHAQRWKLAMAHHVVTHDFIKYGDSLVLGSGTTLMHLMSTSVDSQVADGAGLDLAIFTNNLQVLYAARDAQREHGGIFAGTQVLLTGGRLNSPLDSLIGESAAKTVASSGFLPRTVFFGSAGLSFEGGLTIGYQFEDELSTQMAFATRPTQQRVLLVDHLKLGRVFGYVAPLTLDALMKDTDICYVLTTFEPEDAACRLTLDREKRALERLLDASRSSPDLTGREFVFRAIREDGSVEFEIRLSDRTSPVAKLKTAKGPTTGS